MHARMRVIFMYVLQCVCERTQVYVCESK